MEVFSILKNACSGFKIAYYAYKMSSAKTPKKRTTKFRSLSQYTEDQVYFLSFAQSWCGQRPKNPFELFGDEKTDVHAPDVYRPLGVIENFPAFRAAFECPLNDTYTPSKHCNLWTLF